MSEIESFRVEAAQWLECEAPAELRGLVLQGEASGNWGGRRAVFTPPAMKTWLERCAARGWTAPTWPREYGGGGLTTEQAKTLAAEIRRLRLPPPLTGFGLTMIGPTLLRFGNEEQKREHLPRIARGEIRWCQGYSEPAAGSDLASLATRAEREGDELIVNGEKVWTSFGDLSDWIFALVRTNPQASKQAGISFLLIDMATPGITVKPIRLISGASPFCETRFENVRVPLRNVVGAVDGGWTIAKALLGHERSMIADVFGSSGSSGRPRSASALADAARRYRGGAEGEVLSDGALRDRIAQCEMDEKALGLTVQRSRDAARAGHAPGPESSLFKVYATELNKRRTQLQVEIAGSQGLGWEGPGFDEAELAATRGWLRARGNSIEGGTSEIQLEIIAKRVLGLPD